MDSSLLQRYRHDRRNLLDFILSSGLISDVPTSSASDFDFDAISADYVLECIQSGGGAFDISKATMKHTDESMFPTMIHSQSGDSFFLLSAPDSAGSPPRRVPPSVETNRAHRDRPHMSTPPDSFTGLEATITGYDCGVNHSYTVPSSSNFAKKTDIPSLGLPALRTGLSDDDLRESAYEVLLSCIAFSGIAIHSLENPKKDKGSRFLTGLKSRRDRRHHRSHSVENHFEHIDTIRVQMQISEAMDECIRQRLMQFSMRKLHVQVDIPQISIELLSGIQQNDFLVERSYTQWRKRQANVLEELFSSVSYPEMQELGILLDKIRNPEEWNIIMTPAERSEVLLAIRQVASLLSSMQGSSSIQGGSSYWNAGYHLNIRLYEKLLFGVFDILDEGQLIEEHAEYLKLIKLTWATLGITQKMHDALYGWVLFQQFIETEEMLLLDQANLQVQKVLSANYDKGNEDHCKDNLMCMVVYNGTETRLSLVQAIFRSINVWCDRRLQDYHLHFSEKSSFFQRLVSMGLAVGTDNSGTGNKVKVGPSAKSFDFLFQLINSDAIGETAAFRVRVYVERSVEAACKRVEDAINLISKLEGKHPLALLASELRMINERERSLYSPVLCQWCPDAGMVVSRHLHQFYGKRLPFLDDISLSEDAISVLSAAHHLELDLIRSPNSEDEENGVGSFSINEIDFYQIHKISRPIVLDWLISQHERMLEWTGRAFHLEVWEPLSNQQKQAASVVEVFRIVEETVDQLFRLSLPMDISHLQALLSINFHALDGYLLKLVSQLVEKHHLYPAAPPLTRYKETMFPIVKKKVVESVLLDEEVDEKLRGLTVNKLCVRLNTLQYMQKQINILEDGIKKSWASMGPGNSRDCKEPPGTTDFILTDSESVDELFVATFDSIRDSVADAIRKICDLVGTKIIFWDLRDSFLFRLYHGTVEGARLENLLPQLDSILNHVCGLIDDALRDMVVASICRAALEGYVWVLLDGGPSCAFSDSDITMMEDDLNMLKDLFVADGEGLPRSLVEVESKLAHQILSLFSLDAESVIHMLMMASEYLSTGFELRISGQRSLDDANTLIRVLCHKKDREASKFLKLQYHLPASSDYIDTPSFEPTPKSPIGAEFLKSASARWGEKGNSSFRLLKKRFQEVQGGSFRWS
ncbi:protein unc-13 homolog isoform X2 [Cynara cardunculus var. scolymus]|uniref:protein unc-13 homolog isoform X2 n=1 Tax=Cynara cardunculus var. scolymus TaxID=59895 RepID=UPI000D62FF08|nr:protein unc-13 homolog isoform X2 [Cynara cardunculus var. scolymus]